MLQHNWCKQTTRRTEARMSSFISDSKKTKDKHKNKQPSVQTTIDHWIVIITITYHFQLQRFVNQQAVLKKLDGD